MHRSSDKHLDCSNGMNLDYFKMMTITSDYGMSIITLDNLYFVLSCRSTLLDVVSVLYRRRADSGVIGALLG
jgi:hypothetical protein